MYHMTTGRTTIIIATLLSYYTFMELLPLVLFVFSSYSATMSCGC